MVCDQRCGLPLEGDIRAAGNCGNDMEMPLVIRPKSTVEDRYNDFASRESGL
jgi:hypothetical protein